MSHEITVEALIFRETPKIPMIRIKHRIPPFKELRDRSRIFKKLAKLFKIIISNPFKSSPFLAILVPFSSTITPLLFFLLSKTLCVGFAAF